MRERKRKPSHPGKVLKNLYLVPLSLTITEISTRIGVSRKALSKIVNEQKSVTPEMAIRLSKFFETTPDMWLNLQKNYDLWKVLNNGIVFDIQSVSSIRNSLYPA